MPGELFFTKFSQFLNEIRRIGIPGGIALSLLIYLYVRTCVTPPGLLGTCWFGVGLAWGWRKIKTVFELKHVPMHMRMHMRLGRYNNQNDLL